MEPVFAILIWSQDRDMSFLNFISSFVACFSESKTLTSTGTDKICKHRIILQVRHYNKIFNKSGNTNTFEVIKYMFKNEKSDNTGQKLEVDFKESGTTSQTNRYRLFFMLCFREISNFFLEQMLVLVKLTCFLFLCIVTVWNLEALHQIL